MKKRVVIIVLLAMVLTLFAFPLTASAQNTWHVSKWTKYQGNPVLNPGSAGEWDDTYVHGPEVLHDGTTYRMWYSGYDGTTGRIGYATSPDGITWTKYAGNPVLNPGSAGVWDDAGVYRADVLYDGTTYHMWYDGCDGTSFRIGYATSPDGITWTKYAGNPVLNPGSAGEWDDAYVQSPSVLYDGTTYHMWYDGSNGTTNGIGYATSPDGITWTKYAGNPILNPGSAGEWDDSFINRPDVLSDGTTYHMLYGGDDGSVTYSIGYASSTNGTNWTKYDDPTTTTHPYAGSDPVLNPGPSGEWDDTCIYSPGFLYDGTTYHMWYSSVDGTSRRIGYATNSYIDADFLSIQNAIEYADPYDTVLVHPAKYDETLLIDESLTLQSTDGWQNTMIDPVTDSIIRIQGPVEVTVQGFDLSGGSWGVHVGSAEKRVNILDCFIHHNAADGIYVAGGGTLLNIERNIISANGNPGGGCGIYIEEAWSTVNILDNTVGSFGILCPSSNSTMNVSNGDGIRIDDVPAGTDVAINDNFIGANEDDGIDLAPASGVDGAVTIEDNIIGPWEYPYGGCRFLGGRNADNGIHVGEVSDTGTITIEGNAISENGHDGINFGQGVGPILGEAIIRDNIIGGWTYYPGDYGYAGDPQRYYGNGAEGIYISQVGEPATVTIERNRISENARVVPDTGITIDDMYGVVIIANNDIGAWEDSHGENYLGNGGQGVYIYWVYPGAVLTIGPDNSIKENTDDGIEIFNAQPAGAANVTVHHNTIEGNDSDGIELGTPCEVDGATISHNTITNHVVGINMTGPSDHNTISDNEISNNGEGIWIEGHDNQILRNNIRNNKRAGSGIHLTSTATGNVIHCNNIEGNLLYGVYNGNDSMVVNATYNWWGAADGPSTSPGSGDKVSDNVTYAPWLAMEFQYCPECGGTPPVPVGGEAYPINKLAILAPWIALIAAIMAGATIIWRRRKAQR